MSTRHNAGLPGLLFKGKVIKSQNQWYNKQIARIQSEQTKGGTIPFVPTEEFDRITLKRNNRINDFMHKTAKRIMEWCLQNHIDTVVIGANRLWKQNSNLKKIEKQSFVEIPHTRFREIMQYLCERHGLHYLEQEESYTSKASFRFMDSIPTYGEERQETTGIMFSGRRAPTSYKGNYKKTGFRGIYKDQDGSFVNSDLNGSANIGRKCLPALFTPNRVVIDKAEVIRFPDDKKMYPLWGRGYVI